MDTDSKLQELEKRVAAIEKRLSDDEIMDVVSRRLAEATAIDLNGLRVKLLAILQSHGGWRA